MVKKKISKQKITANMTFSEVAKKYPETSEVFFKHGMMCIGCPMAMGETIKQGCEAHGIDVKRFLEELNKKIGGKNV